MARIFGAALKEKEAYDILIEGLKKLEFSPYDSCGIATIHNSVIYAKKNKGRVDEVFSDESKKLEGKVGIGHLRWATHGAPAEFNSHPILDCKKSIAVVQNGVIGNFLELKNELVGNHKFVSKTDTEVIAHAIERSIEYSNDTVKSISEVFKRLEGCFSVALITTKLEDSIIAINKGQPLFIGLGKEGNFLSSEIASFVQKTNKYVRIEENELAIINSENFSIYNLNENSKVEKQILETEWDEVKAKKLGYEHMVLREIMEQPLIFRTVMFVQRPYLELISEFLDKAPKNFIVAMHSSYNASVAASYYFSKLANITVFPALATEFVEQFGSSIDINTTILFSSPSGRDKEILSAVEFARMRACTILALCNEAYSPLTGMSRAYIVQNSGSPLTKYSVKDFTSQLIVYLYLALTLAKKRGKISQDEIETIMDEIKDLPSLASEVILKTYKNIRNVAKFIAKKGYVLVLGRGISHATALEGKTKLEEMAKMNAIAYPAGESKHGPISLIEKDIPVVFVAPPDETRKLLIGNIQEMSAREAYVVSICAEGDEEIRSVSKEIIEMPKMHNLIAPILYTLPLQLLAYFIALEKGIEID